MEILEAYSLKEHNTWKVGGEAEYATFPETVKDVQEACQWAKEKDLPITVLSSGSNVLISEQGVPGLTLLLQRLSGVEQHNATETTITLECLAGTPKSEILRYFIKAKFSPALFLAGLPGDMGGGVVMNAGVGHEIQPKEFCELISWIEYVDLNSETFEVKRMSAKDIKWSYRKSEGWQPGVLTKMGVSWQETPDPDLIKKLQENNKRRMSTQPLQYPSCGSVFKNPEGHSSGQLIESCGLKGFQIGGAQISEKHANFIINVDGATADDIYKVILHAQAEVKKQKSISLQTECVFLGRW